MPTTVPLRRKRKVVFLKSTPKSQLPTPETRQSAELRRLSLEEEEAMAVEELPKSPDVPPIPSLFSHYPPIRDELETESSKLQDETIEECLPFLTASEYDLNVFGVPQLMRMKHVGFLTNALTEKYPPPFVAMDASKAWIPYWALTGLYALGEDPSEYRER